MNEPWVLEQLGTIPEPGTRIPYDPNSLDKKFSFGTDAEGLYVLLT